MTDDGDSHTYYKKYVTHHAIYSVIYEKQINRRLILLINDGINMGSCILFRKLQSNSAICLAKWLIFV